MFKKLSKAALLTIVAISAIIGMEPETTRTIAAKSFVKQSQKSKKLPSQKVREYYFTESSYEEIPCGESSSEYSFEVINPLSYLFEQKIFNLAEYDNKSGSVFPIYTGPKGQLYVILTREAYGKDKGKYDDFSGGREKKDKHPMISAAREFHEEAILEKTLGWNLNDVIHYLDSDNNGMLTVVAYSKNKNPQRPQSKDIRNVTYIVDFNQYAKKLFNTFYTALTSEKAKKHRSTTEKDRIAGVLLNDLKEAVIHKKDREAVRISANVLDPKTNRFNKEQITLRPFLVEKLRQYFLDMPYDQGENAKTRHYRFQR